MSFKILHRYLGWMAFFPFGLLAFTGILLALSGQIERILEPKLYSVKPSYQLALDLQAIRTRLVEDYGSSVILAPRNGAFDTFQAQYTSLSGEARQVWIDPITGNTLADRALATRLDKRLLKWHRLGYSPLAVVVSLLASWLIITGLWLFPAYQRGRFFWHNYTMLAVAPFALWQAATGVLIGFDRDSATILALHNPPIFAIRLLVVVAMLSLITGLVFVVIGNQKD